MATPTSRRLRAAGRESERQRSRAQLLYLLHTPLAELNPPGLPADQRAGLRSLPEANRLKLIYAFKALEPLAERPPAAAYGALHLTDIPPTWSRAGKGRCHPLRCRCRLEPLPSRDFRCSPPEKASSAPP